MPSWVSQGVLLGATGPTGPTGPTGASGIQTTTTTASFTMPAVNGTVTIAVTAAAWTKLGQTLYISDGTNSGWWEITTRTSTTSLVVTNRGYTGNPTSGTMATAAVVQLAGPGIAAGIVPGFAPGEPVRTFLSSSFTIPALGSTVTIAVVSAAWTTLGQLLWISDGTRVGFYEITTRTSATSLVVTYRSSASTGTMATRADVVLMGLGYAVSANPGVTAGSPGIMPPWDNTVFFLNTGVFSLGAIPSNIPPNPHGPTHLSTDPSGGTSHYYANEEFVAPPQLGSVANSGGAGAISSIYQGVLAAGHVGALQLAAGTATAQYARYYTNPVALQSGFSMTLRAIIQVVSALTSAEVFFGVTDQPGPILDTSHNYIGFLFQPNTSANWGTITRAVASVTGPTSTGTAAIGAWVDLKITITPGSIGFYVNGVLFSTITTTIPGSSVVLFPCVFVSSNTVTSNPQALVDMFEMDIDSSNATKFSKASI